MTKKTKAQLQQENQDLRAQIRMLQRLNLAESIASVLNNLIKWAGLACIAMFCYWSIDALAGESTTADIGLNLLANIEISKALAWALGGAGVVYGLRQRKLRRDTIEKFHPRIKELESSQDPGRSTSGLTQRGGTHPRDE